MLSINRPAQRDLLATKFGRPSTRRDLLRLDNNRRLPADRRGRRPVGPGRRPLRRRAPPALSWGCTSASMPSRTTGLLRHTPHPRTMQPSVSQPGRRRATTPCVLRTTRASHDSRIRHPIPRAICRRAQDGLLLRSARESSAARRILRRTYRARFVLLHGWILRPGQETRQCS